VRIPGGLIFRPSGQKAINGQIDQVFFSRALDGMQRARRDADDVSGLDGKFFSLRADAQNSTAFQDVKNLFGVIVPVQGRGFSRFDDDDKDLGGFGISAVHDQIVDVGWKLIALDAGGGKYKLRGTLRGSGFASVTV
jgi:hypothetical protein